MQNSVWIDLFHLIPSHLHNAISIVTNTGQELIAQQFYRFDSEIVVMRARLSGSMEGARVVLLPYGHIDYLALTKVLLEGEIQEIFGTSGGIPASAAVSRPVPMEEVAPQPRIAPAPAAPAVAGAVTHGPGVAAMTQGPGGVMQTASLRLKPKSSPDLTVAAASPLSPGPDAHSAGSDSTETKPGQVSKSLLLARLRERLSQKK